MSEPKWLKRPQRRRGGGDGWREGVVESGLGGDGATLCNGATAIVSGGNEEAKVMHPENRGQLDPTPH